MPKKKKRKKNNRDFTKKKTKFALPSQTKQWIWGVLMLLVAILSALSFFGKSGVAGSYFMKLSKLAIGETVFIIPLVFALGGLIFLTAKKVIGEEKKIVFWPVFLATLLLVSGSTGILGSFNSATKMGGWLGFMLSWPLLKYFSFWATLIIFIAPVVIGLLIFWQFLKPSANKNQVDSEKEEARPKTSIIKKIFAPRFKVKEVPHHFEEQGIKEPEKQEEPLDLGTKPVGNSKISTYQPPPIDLLEKEKGVPNSGDTKTNSAIIQKTFHDFGISVAMSEINIGPTVTQYTLKPADGVKLSKIVGLSNDLALSLASHPIRIEAPVPGRSLVGIEVPNKGRAQVRLRNMIESPSFQKSSSNLVVALGKDVSGFPVYTDLTKMPHLLVAGATGSGKTIFLNSLILNLLYQQNTAVKSAGPELLRLILVDPKRVEFPVYANLPHLLCPIIYNAHQTVNALKWLIGEMERRFGVLADAGARDIGSFNQKALKNETDPLPFIVLVIDELADLMAARGREIEAEIVRLAQMARAVGIHLVLATQRPSVEVITGLIKANITSRISFQVASQVDSRTIMDTAGAEKLLGAGDMLYTSSTVPKPKRLQAAYVSDKEVRRVIGHINANKEKVIHEMDSDLIEQLDQGANGDGARTGLFDGDDPLYEDAKREVIQAKKASASFLQRRLRVGYARAARLIDMMEDKGVVSPGDGAKPREVYTSKEEEPSEGDDWQKV